jgi:hypothetical protein
VLGPLTEPELSAAKAVPVKLIYGELTELKSSHRATVAELQTERQRNETLTARAHASEIECCALRERLHSTGHRDSIARLLETVMAILIVYSLERALAGNWAHSIVSGSLGVLLGCAVYLLQRGPISRENK